MYISKYNERNSLTSRHKITFDGLLLKPINQSWDILTDHCCSKFEPNCMTDTYNLVILVNIYIYLTFWKVPDNKDYVTWYPTGRRKINTILPFWINSI